MYVNGYSVRTGEEPLEAAVKRLEQRTIALAKSLQEFRSEEAKHWTEIYSIIGIRNNLQIREYPQDADV